MEAAGGGGLWGGVEKRRFVFAADRGGRRGIGGRDGQAGVGGGAEEEE